MSIIIPNWNGARFLPTCLDALAKQTHPHLEIIVVDNASQDESITLLENNYSHVKLIALDENRGFTGACNTGIEQATGDFIALLNNDTEVDSNWATAILAAFQRHPDAGSAASKMLLFDKRDQFHTAGDYFTLDGRAGNRGVWEQDVGQYNQEQYVFSACGGSSVYRRTMLDQIGWLDDDFFFSGEDVDLGWRAQLTGWRCIYVPDAIVYHHLSATGGGTTASYYDGRNLIFILAKNYPTDLWRKYGWHIIRAQWTLAWEAIRAWRGEAARARLHGMLAGLMGLPHIWHKRQAIQASRTVSIVYLEQILTTPDEMK